VTEVIQQALNALSLGGLYALLALGLAIVFSVMGLVNFAHGELITLSGFTMLGLGYLGVPAAVLLPCGVLAATLTAVATERVAFRPVRNAAPTTMLLTSFGVSILIQNVLLLVVTGGQPRAVPTPAWITGLVHLGPFDIQVLQILTTAVTGLALGVLLVVLRRTMLGLAMRAAAENFTVVRLMGVNADRVVAGAFAVSGFLAGLAGVLYVARRGAVDPFMGFIPVLKAFVAAVLGGFGNLSGAVVGGFVLGAMEVTLEAVLPATVAGYRDAFVFLAVGAVMVTRPQGLFGRASQVIA
jgi:branched-chain amino acid transport system permease protein